MIPSIAKCDSLRSISTSSFCRQRILRQNVKTFTKLLIRDRYYFQDNVYLKLINNFVYREIHTYGEIINLETRYFVPLYTGLLYN